MIKQPPKIDRYDLEKAYQRHANLIQMELKFRSNLPSIFLLQIDETMEKELSTVSNWLIGNKTNQPKAVKVAEFSLTIQQINVHVLQTSECRIVALDFTWFNVDNLPALKVSREKRAQRLFELRKLFDLVGHWQSPVKVYAVMEGERNKLWKNFEDKSKIKLSGVICCGGRSQNKINKMSIPSDVQGFCPYSVQQLFSEGNIEFEQLDNIWKLDFIEEKGRNFSREEAYLYEYKVLKKLICEKNSYILCYLMAPLKNLISNFSDQQMNLANIFDKVEEILSHDVDPKDELVFRESIYEKQEKLKKLEERDQADQFGDLALYSFMMEVEKNYLQFKQARSSRVEDLDNLKNFIGSILEQIHILSLSIKSEAITKIYSFIQSLFKEHKTVTKILKENGENFQGHTVAIFVDFWEDSFIQKKQVLQVLLKKKIMPDLSKEYYETYERLLEKMYDKDAYQKDHRQKIENELFEMKQNLKIQKVQTILSASSCKKNKIQGIKLLFELWKYRSINSQMFNFKNFLIKLGVLLREIDRPDLALEVYKKMGQVHRIEDCIREMEELDLVERKNRQQLYSNLWRYFRSVKNDEMARKYHDLAEQEELKNNFIVNENNFSSFNEGIEDEDFFIMFKQKLSKLSCDEAESDEDLSISIDPNVRLPRILSKLRK